MSAESLLLWMSARVHGSWGQFRAAVEELHLDEGNDDEGDADDGENLGENGLPHYHLLRLNLQRLGHAEFFSEAAGSDWHVCPPCLAATPLRNEWIGILVGARSARLIDRLLESAAQSTLETLEFDGCPDQLKIVAPDSQTLARIAQRANIYFQDSAPESILAVIPRIDEAAIRKSTPIPFGAQWRVERFSATSLRWEAASAQEARTTTAGLFRFVRLYERTVLLCTHGHGYAVPSQVGKYLALKARRRRVLQYDRTAECLTLPSSCRPPFLVDRALTLCSGAPPRYEARTAMSGLLHYSNIPAPIARLASASLCQELR